MNSSLPLDLLNQLQTLSLEQLLELRTTIDVVLLNKSIEFNIYSVPKPTNSLIEKTEFNIGRKLEFKQEKDTSLQEVLNLVDEWMNDDTEYDKDTYYEIQSSLKIISTFETKK